MTCSSSCKNFLQIEILQDYLQEITNLGSFTSKIFTIFLQDMQENGHFAWTSYKSCKKY